jgi:hypothetical protein
MDAEIFPQPNHRQNALRRWGGRGAAALVKAHTLEECLHFPAARLARKEARGEHGDQNRSRLQLAPQRFLPSRSRRNPRRIHEADLRLVRMHHGQLDAKAVEEPPHEGLPVFSGVTQYKERHAAILTEGPVMPARHPFNRADLEPAHRSEALSHTPDTRGAWATAAA